MRDFNTWRHAQLQDSSRPPYMQHNTLYSNILAYRSIGIYIYISMHVYMCACTCVYTHLNASLQQCKKCGRGTWLFSHWSSCGCAGQLRGCDLLVEARLNFWAHVNVARAAFTWSSGHGMPFWLDLVLDSAPICAVVFPMDPMENCSQL